VFCSASSPRRFFVDDRKNDEHYANRIRFDHSTVRFRFDRTGQDRSTTQSGLRRSSGAEGSRKKSLISEMSIFETLKK
jgi:hypothetical protein